MFDYGYDVMDMIRGISYANIVDDRYDDQVILCDN